MNGRAKTSVLDFTIDEVNEMIKNTPDNSSMWGRCLAILKNRAELEAQSNLLVEEILLKDEENVFNHCNEISKEINKMDKFSLKVKEIDSDPKFIKLFSDYSTLRDLSSQVDQMRISIESEIKKLSTQMESLGLKGEDWASLNQEDYEETLSDRKQKMQAEVQLLSQEILKADIQSHIKEANKKAEDLMLSVLPFSSNIKEALFKGNIASALAAFSNGRLKKAEERLNSNVNEESSQLVNRVRKSST